MKTPGLRAAALALAAAASLAAPGRAQPTVTLPAADRALPGPLAPVYTLERPGGAGGERFGAVAAVAFDRDDNLYVLDRDRRRVTVHDRTGKLLREIGGEGRLSTPMDLAVTDDGAVLVADLHGGGVAVFGRDGAHRTTVRFPAGFSLNVGVRPHPGGMMATLRPAAADRSPRGTPIRFSTALAVVPVAGGAPREVLIVRETTDAEESTSQSAAGGQGVQLTTRVRPALGVALQWGVLPGGGVAYAATEQYRVHVAGPDGRVQRILRRAVAPRAVSDADRRAWAEARARASGGQTVVAGGGGVPAAALRAQLADREFAPLLPVVQRLAVDRKGRIWIQRPGPVWGQPGPVDVVEPDGTYLGTIRADEMPRAFSPGGLAASVVRDAGGAQRVVVRRLPPALR